MTHDEYLRRHNPLTPAAAREEADRAFFLAADTYCYFARPDVSSGGKARQRAAMLLAWRAREYMRNATKGR